MSEVPRRGVQGVSYPRSGHSLLVNFLRFYFGDKFHYCEYYGGCQQIPCKCKENNFQKNHDFGLSLGIPYDQPLLIQIRNPIYSIVSNFNLAVGRDPSLNSVENWERYSLQSIAAWRAWVHKWVLGLDHKDALILKYDEVIESPEEELCRVVSFFGVPLLREQVRFALNEINVHRRTPLSQFPWYNIDFLRWVEQYVAYEMQEIRIPKFDQIETV